MINIDADRAVEFLSFVENRHQVWERRQLGVAQPWTDDPIVASRKFTNVFRILDPGTQFILTDLLDAELDPRDMLMRLFLYRHTGRTEVWRHSRDVMGRYPVLSDLPEMLDVWKEYRGEATVRTRNVDPKNRNRTTQTDFKRSVFTSAYLVFPQTHTKGSDKLESIFALTERLFSPDSSDDVVLDFLMAETQEERFTCLRRNKGVADFMSMQILTDWGYLPEPFCGEDREDEFIVLGPGAVKGAKALGTGKPSDIHLWAVDAIRQLEFVVLEPQEVWPRRPSYMDAQNCLCEFSKYVRYTAKPAPASLYTPAHPGPQEPPVLPSHW